MAASPHAFSSHLRFPPGLFLFRIVGLFFIVWGRTGGGDWIHAVSVWCFWRCLLQHAHCGPPHPLTSSSSSSSSMFLDTLHHLLAPHSICASCLPLTGLQYERAGLDCDSQCASQTSILYCQLKSKLVLQHLHVEVYDRSSLFLAAEGLVHFILTVALLDARSGSALHKEPRILMALCCHTVQ